MKQIVLFLNFLLIYSLNDYTLTDVKFNEMMNKMNGTLLYSKDDFNIDDYNIKQIRNKNVELIRELSVNVRLECDEIFHIQIKDRNKKRWEPPYIIDEKYKKKIQECDNKISLNDFGFEYKNETFSFSLSRNNETYYNWENGKFFFSETLIVFESFLTSDNIYGFGERSRKFKLDQGIYTIWTNDTGNVLDTADGGKGLYGVQPFGLHRTKSGLFVGILFFNINSQDFLITKNEKVSLEHRTIGGIIDLYIFTGNNPEEVLMKYHSIIGKPALPPYWSLGWQQSRWGYKTDTDLRKIFKRYEEENIPLDVLYNDIDYMEDYRDFSVSKNRYGNLNKLIQELHANDKRYIPILDIGIPFNETDKFYNLGMEMNVFIISNYTKVPLRNIVWPGICVFPDWFNPNTTIFWKTGLKELNNLINFDGVWQDMNEPAALWSDSIGKGEVNYTNIPENNIYENIPYIPGNGYSDLNTHSISVNAINFGEEKYMTIFNTKPMISFFQAKSTYEFFLSNKKRPFILSRANVLGSNRYSYHWLGDNDSSYESMKMSVSGIMNYQMFGYSMVSSDICGFNNDSNDKLCSRWHSLGAFYPFSRNHNTIGAKDQEPFAIGNLTLNSAKKALAIRYSLIRYMYTIIFKMSLRGGSFFKPLFFEFYDDIRTYEDIENNLMFGDAFIFYPVFSDSEDDLDAYIPNSNWNSFPSLDNFITYNPKTQKGSDIKLSGKFDAIHLYLRGGYIVPRQETNYPVVLSTNQLRRIGTELIINPDQFKNAEGDIIFDDGYNNNYEENYLHIRMIYNYNQLLFNRIREINEYNYKDIKLTKITYLRTDYLSKNLKAQIKDLDNNLFVTPCIYIDDKIIIDLNKFNITFMNVKNIYLVDKDFFEE